MRGELRLVIDRLVREVWIPVAASHEDRDEVASAVFAAASARMVEHYSPIFDEEGGVIGLDPGSPEQSLQARSANCAGSFERAASELEGLEVRDFSCELDVVRLVRDIWEVLDEYEDADGCVEYVSALIQFVGRYSVRYYVGPEAQLHASFPGLATSAFHEFRKICVMSPGLEPLLIEFEQSLAEAVDDPIETRIKTAIAKLFNLMEAAAARNTQNLRSQPDRSTFGELCQQLGVWPHASVMKSVVSLYEFANQYPGLRHGGDPATRKRAVDAGDLLAVCSALIGFTPYFVADVPDSAGLRLERHVRVGAEPQTTSSRGWA